MQYGSGSDSFLFYKLYKTFKLSSLLFFILFLIVSPRICALTAISRSTVPSVAVRLSQSVDMSTYCIVHAAYLCMQYIMFIYMDTVRKYSHMSLLPVKPRT